jgi:uncharacterized protein (TIGR03083 family)
MEIGEHIDRLTSDGLRLAEAVQAVSLDARVASCPGWAVRDLVLHVGGVHRWAAAIVGNAMLDNDEVTGDAVGTGPDDAELLDWFREGHRNLVKTLLEAPSDLVCFTFLPAPSPLAFWARRQAHETAVHRADAEGVLGAVASFDGDFAFDGIDELLMGFASRPRPAIEPGTLLLQADAAAWLVTFGEHGVRAAASPTEFAAGLVADSTLTGSPSDLYLWLWNRPSAATVSGDEVVANRWREIRVRWS